MTLFPDTVRTVLNESIIGRAQAAGIIHVDCQDIRTYSTDKHRKTDDTPFGGGVGMVMTCQPLFDCYAAIDAAIPAGARRRVIYPSPKGRRFTHEVAAELSTYDDLIFLCGHYEGVDQRVIDELVDDEISIGDYVVTGGEIPSCIMIDAISRLLDGVLAESACYEEESIASGILEYPQYTKPRDFRGLTVPPVLLSGDHARIDRWRLEQAVAITRERRPELLASHPEYEAALAPRPSRRRRRQASPPSPDTAEGSAAATSPAPPAEEGEE